MAKFDLQGHRGARGLKPENTLPAFEIALDLMVSTLEGDLQLTRDGVVIFCHDEVLSTRLHRLATGAKAPPPAQRPLISSLSLAEVRHYTCDRNPDPKRFPKQDASPTPAAAAFCKQHGLHTYGLPTLEEFFGFVSAYAGELGQATGKTAAQRERARSVRFNLETKRVPFHREYVGDGFDGGKAGLMEEQVIQAVRKAGVVERTILQSFDHRSVLAARQVEPKLTGAVLIAATAPVLIPTVAQAATAVVYSPDYTFLDERQVRQAQAASLRVIPWTVNDPAPMNRLLDWGVDGIITDFPDRLIPLLQARHMQY